jgi:hypothetical protein
MGGERRCCWRWFAVVAPRPRRNQRRSRDREDRESRAPSVAEGVEGASAGSRRERVFRFKRIIGDRLRSRSLEGQNTEAMIGVKLLNRMTALGMPDSVAVG